jgi:hypothetical protein
MTPSRCDPSETPGQDPIQIGKSSRKTLTKCPTTHTQAPGHEADLARHRKEKEEKQDARAASSSLQERIDLKATLLKHLQDLHKFTARAIKDVNALDVTSDDYAKEITEQLVESTSTVQEAKWELRGAHEMLMVRSMKTADDIYIVLDTFGDFFSGVCKETMADLTSPSTSL